MAAIYPGSGLDQEDSLSSPETSLTSDAPQVASESSLSTQSGWLAAERKKLAMTVLKVVAIGLAALLLFTGILYLVFQWRGSTPSLQTGNFKETYISLKGLSQRESSANPQSLKVRGQLQVTNSLTLSPTNQPQDPISGQLYFDKTRKQMLYYDGSQFVLLQGGSGNTINAISNITTGGAITNVFNGSGGGSSFTGTLGSLAMFTGTSTLGDSLIQQNNDTLQVASSGTHTVTVGSLTGTSSTTIQGGAGNLALTTGSAAAITGSVTISTGDSSTTASGNISIDNGVGIIDGKIIEDKTFESGLNNMQDWFSTSLATTTAQAHSGAQSLAVTPSSQFWGIIEILPGTPVVPGHQYHFSIWVRASTTPRTIGASLVWNGANVTTPFNAVIDSATSWTEMTLTAPAPAGATAVSFRMQSSTGAAGDVHYFDDVTITDLSSGSAISAIDIGSTNAKVVTIGNLNQIGATTIRGGSGISIQSGAASTVITGGSLAMTGNASSSLSTTSGTLTLTSASAAVWGIGTASSGTGGDLTLRAGQGGSDGNNDGGDLFLQGGARNGTGVPGSVIIKPPTDISDAFQIQNSAGIAFLLADTTTKTITISGSGASFATLALANTHFRSTQTAAPTIGAPLNCGTAPTASMTPGSTDTAGSFSITTGTGNSSSSCDATITFNAPYTGAPKSLIVVGKTDAASAARQIYVSNTSSASFTTLFGVPTGGTNSTVYNFSYWVIE